MLKALPNIALTMIWSRAIKRLLGARGEKGQFSHLNWVKVIKMWLKLS